GRGPSPPHVPVPHHADEERDREPEGKEPPWRAAAARTHQRNDGEKEDGRVHEQPASRAEEQPGNSPGERSAPAVGRLRAARGRGGGGTQSPPRGRGGGGGREGPPPPPSSRVLAAGAATGRRR